MDERKHPRRGRLTLAAILGTVLGAGCGGGGHHGFSGSSGGGGATTTELPENPW